MTAEGGGRWEEGPRVRVRPRVAPRGADAPPAIDPLGTALRDLERRFLESLPASPEDPPGQSLAAHLSVLAELKEIDARIQESLGRRDIPFFTDRRLATLAEHCLWLTRRASGELMLVLQVQLEQDLKRMISPQAYQLFLRLEEIEGVARDLDGLDAIALTVRLRDGTLFREILEQVRLGHGAAAAQAGPASDLADPD